MRFKITLEVNRNAFGDILPLNHQYEQSSTIYNILSNAGKEYADWLHDNGYKTESGKRFKLFTYSRFKIEKRKIIPSEESIKILCNTIEWQISFLPEKSTAQFIQGIFSNQTFEIGNKQHVVQFHVKTIEVLPLPIFSDEMEFSTMSPICIKLKKEDGKIDYLSPTDERAPFLIFNGLLDRYKAFYGEALPCKPTDCKLEITSVPKSALIMIKAGTKAQTKVRGFQCQFKVKAPIELMQIMYESGIGEECSQGFGCVKINTNK